MKWIQTKITFESKNDELAVDLIADVFYELNAKGVVVDDPGMEPEEGWGSDAVPRASRPAVTGYLPADDRLESRRQTLEHSLSRLAVENGITHTIAYQSIDEEDWAESWKAYFWPQEITSRIAVKPTWRDYHPKPGQRVIEIDPGMAFGTGTHETTSLCIQMLERYIRPGDTVLDVGTGSGILLIAAAKLGAGWLTGIDLDPMAVEVAGKNMVQNRIAAQEVDLHCGDLTRAVGGTYDLVVANILADVIIVLLDDVGRTLKPGGIFICSGIIEASQTKVVEKMAARSFDIVEIKKDGEWVSIAGRLNS